MNTHVNHLQEASDHRYLGKLLMKRGIESAVSGLLLGLIAIPTLLRHGTGIPLVWLLMIALVGHGLFIAVKPYPKGLIVDSILKCCSGCIFIMASLPQTFIILIRPFVVPWWTIGLAEIAGALVWLFRYNRIRHVRGTISAEWLNYLDRLVAGVNAAVEAHDPSTIEVMQRVGFGADKLKGQLYSDLAVFVGPGGREVLIADRADFALGSAEKSPFKGKVAAEMNYGNRKIKIMATQEAYNQLSAWSKATVIPVLAPV